MSRIGKLPIPIPPGVQVRVEGDVVQVQGPQGRLSQRFEPQYVVIQVVDGEVRVTRTRESKSARARHGLYRSLVANMVQGVQQPYKKALTLKGLGYRAKLEGRDRLVLEVGYAEPKVYPVPEGVAVACPDPTEIVVEGPDKQLVGRVAAEIRAIRKPEPYNGTGIRYKDEHVRQKAGKLAA